MCPRCEGMGTASDIDLTQLYDETKSLAEGAITVPGYTADGWSTRMFSESGFFDADKPIRDFTETELNDFLYKEPVKVRINGINLTYEGLVPKVQKSMLSKDVDALQPHIRAFVDRAVTFSSCPDCGGTRLNEAARSSKIDGISIADACAMQISDLAAWVRGLDEPSVGPLLAALGESLDSFVEMGLGYLSLDRPSGTLSGGEAQRTRMIRHLGSALTDVTYVFDEPTIGLHAHDVERMNTLLERLRDKGNTVLVVEHDPEVIRVADHVVDMGPGAGPHGGTVVFEGTVDGLIASGTATGRHLDVRQELKPEPRAPRGSIPIRNAQLHNLRDVSVDVPLGVLVAVTGVAGSGKSSLIHGCLPRTDPSVTFIDQSAIRGSRRSNPATYTGILDPIRTAFAKANGVKPALFSANSEGACPNCNGLGKTYTSLGFMAEVVSICEVCEGRRYTDDVLEYRLRGRNIVEALAMPVEEARDFFTEKPVRVMLDRLADVGLGYISLGQELDTLSGGERQRLKLAIEMSGATEVYVLDEPTTGLHMQDVDNLVGLLDRLVESGRTVIVIEHNLDVVARADWVIDLGPGAGHDGGTVIFEGPPAELARAEGSLTGAAPPPPAGARRRRGEAAGASIDAGRVAESRISRRRPVASRGPDPTPRGPSSTGPPRDRAGRHSGSTRRWESSGFSMSRAPRPSGRCRAARGPVWITGPVPSARRPRLRRAARRARRRPWNRRARRPAARPMPASVRDELARLAAVGVHHPERAARDPLPSRRS